MPRKAKGVHTSPDKAGVQNLPEGYADSHKDGSGAVQNLMPIWEKGFKNREDYKGLWTEETMSYEINEYFKYCFENDVKPCKAGLALWLGTYKQQIWEWEKFPEKHGFKTELMRFANGLIESSYVGRIEQYPTGNIFLLKSSHGHAEATKIEITNQNGTNPDEIADTIAKLGLDKQDTE